jgi:hypothetical protein
VALASLVASAHAVLLLGRLHPDEVFQFFEPALHRAFGFGVLAWEWQVGLRNWAVPGLFAALLELGERLGIQSVSGRRLLLEGPNLLLHAAMLAAVWRFSMRRAGVWVARWCLWLIALYGPIVWFAGRSMSEAFSVGFLVWALERLDANERWSAASAGVLLGLAEVCRYGSAAAILPVLIFLLGGRRWRTLLLVCASGAAVAVLLGLLDKLTWGTWFHSLRAYVDFNVTSGRAAEQFGKSPWWTYLPLLFVGPWALVGFVVGLKRPALRSALFLWVGLGYLTAISLTPHKEPRFIYPTLVLLTIAGTPAFVVWATETPGRMVRGALLAIVSLVAFYLVPTPFDVQRKEQFQLTAKASSTATGFVLMNEGMWGSGGFFYLGKNLPWCRCDFPEEPCFQMAASDARFNRGVFWRMNDDANRLNRSLAAFEGAGFRLAEQRGDAMLFERP